MSKKMILIVVAVVAAVAVAAGAVLVFVGLNAQDKPQGPAEYTLYWNMDGIDYYTNDESSRQANDDGTCTMRFAVNGELVELKAESRRLANSMDSLCGLQAHGLMGLQFNEEGIIVGFSKLVEMPLTVRGSMFFVQAVAGGKVKLNSTPNFMSIAMQDLLETTENTKIYDMTGTGNQVGASGKLQVGDQVLGIANEAGEITHIFIIAREGSNESKVTYCPHCKEDVLWTGWYKDTELPLDGGHYYLVTDVNLKKQHQIKEEAKICFDLNGYTVNGAYNKRIYVTFNVGSSLAMMDSSEAGTGKLVVNSDENCTTGGMGVWVRNGTFDMYGGTIDASAGVTTVYGLAVNVAKATSFNMHGGTIIGGKAIPNIDGKNGYAGALHVGGVFNMRGGVIMGGYAEKGGGNVVVAKNGTFNMFGGEIKDGTAYASSGGNLNVNPGAFFNMYGGTIRDGVSLRGENGGGAAPNVFMQGEMTMTGGTITGAIMKQPNGDVMLAHGRNLMIRGTANISGGTITGSVRVVKAEGIEGKLILSGNATIYGAEEGTSNLRVDDDAFIKVEGMTGGKVGVTLPEGGGVFTEKTAAGNAKYFVSDVGSKVVHYKNALAVGELACTCGVSAGNKHLAGCDGKKLFWEPFGAKISKTEGNYYLTSDVTGTITLKEKVRIDLNGYSVYADADQRAWTVDGDVTVVNSRSVKGGGKIIGDAKGNRGGAIIVNPTGALTLCNGVTVTVTDNAEPTSAGAIDVAGTLKLAGGSVVGTPKATGNGKAIRLNGGKLDAVAGSVTKGDIYLHLGEIAINGPVSIEALNLKGRLLTLSESAVTKDLKLGIITDVNAKILDKSAVSESVWNQLIENGNLFSADDEAIIKVREDGLYFVSRHVVIHCVCGAEKQEGATCAVCGTAVVEWAPWNGKDTIKTSGYYYLTQDITGAEAGTSAYSYAGIEVWIDLNGHNWTSYAGTRPINIQAGGMVLVTNTGTADGAHGVISGSYVNPELGIGSGGTIQVMQEATLKLYSGVTVKSGLTNAGRGGVIEMRGTMELHGATIDATGVTADIGAAICVNDGKSLIITSGTVIGGTSERGSAIAVGHLNGGASIELRGGKIENGTVLVYPNSTVVVADKAVELDNAQILLQPTEIGKVLTKDSAMDDAQWAKYAELVEQWKIKAAGDVYVLRVKADGLYSASIYERLQCLCGKHTDTETACAVCGSPALSFMPWPYAASTQATRPESGNYYLTDNISAYIQLTDGVELNIDLNGFNWEGVSGRALQQTATGDAATVNICNTGAAATITGKQNAGGGGAIWVRAGMDVTLWENITVQVAEGVTPNDGGIAKVDGGSLTINGATINGTAIAAGKKGTAVYVADAGSFTMNSGTVNGAATGDAIYSFGALNFAGGTVNGDVYIADGTVAVSGDTKLSRVVLNGSSLTVGEMTTGASVKVDKPAGQVFVADTVENYTAVVGYVNAGYISAYSPFSSVNTQGGLSMTGKISCICGNTVATGATCADCGTAVQPWQAWNGTTSVVEGYYYLTGDASVTISTGAGKHLAVDLNGYNWTVASERVASFKGTFTLMNTGLSDATHGIVSGNYAGRGSTILVQGGTLNLYEGVTLKTAKQTYSGRGGVVNVSKNGAICGTMNLYGAVIDATGNTWDIGAAVCIDSECSATMYSGTIIGGSANYGSAVAVGHNATGNASFTMTGGTVQGGDVYRYPGANVNVSGDASIENLVLN